MSRRHTPGYVLPIGRRSALRLGVTGLAGGLAGCLGFDDETDPTRLVSLSVMNHDTNSHTLNVRLRDTTVSEGDSVVYSRSPDLPAASSSDDVTGVEYSDFPPRPW